jgi:hypothetical protein
VNHLQRIYRCKSEQNARKCAAKIALELQTYRSAMAFGLNLCEAVPTRINVNDEIENTKFGKSFRSNYADHLVRAWIRNNRKTIIDSAYRVAVRKLKRELHIATSAAKNILLQRCKNDFYEYQDESAYR